MSVRKFDTGATRDTDDGKHDYEGFLSPLVIESYGAYMHKNRHQSDGTLRDSDNWQKGMSLPVYMKSLWRHFFATWRLHRKMVKWAAATDPAEPTNSELFYELSVADLDALEEDLNGVLFNTMGYLHELRSFRDAN